MTNSTHLDRSVSLELPDEAMISVLRSKTAAERLAIANGMWRSARCMISSLLRAEHADWSDAQVAAETARRLSHGTC